MKWLGLLVLWVAGAAAAVAVAWQGVSVVDDEVIGPAPATAFGELEPGEGTVGEEAATDAGATAGAGTTAAAPDDGGGDEPTGDGTTGDGGPTVPSTGPGRPTGGSDTGGGAGGSESSATPPTDRESEVRTYRLVGGSVAVSFAASGVEVLWATPAPGFTVGVERGDTVRVEFRGDDHRSRLDASWAGGPVADVREDDRDDGPDDDPPDDDRGVSEPDDADVERDDADERDEDPDERDDAEDRRDDGERDDA